MRCGIIPVMVHPESGCVYVLLGRNRTAESYPGSNSWSDFGGMAEVGESAEACAAREVAEESLETLVKYHERHIMQQALTDGEFIFKRSEAGSVHFFVKFKWNPGCIFEFGSIHKILSSMSKVCKKYELTNSERATLKKYRWFCKDSRLGDILQHPAIVYRTQYLKTDTISCAQSKFAAHLELRPGSKLGAERARVRVRVIDEIKNQWLEKDSMQLFSIPQICAMLCQGSVSCSKGICSQLDTEIGPSLTQFIRTLRFQCGSCLAP